MAISWNEDQLHVIRHRDGNLLVSAAAGSGKTTVMIERLLALMTDPEDPVDIDEVLVVTFTNLAAAQMKDKLYSRLMEQIEETKDPQLRERLSVQIRKLKTASIMTIHAFCLQCIRRFVIRIPSLDPGFRVADEGENALLEAGVMDEVLESFYQEALDHPESERSQHFMALVSHYSGERQDQQLEDLISRLSDFLDAIVDPEAWLADAAEAYHIQKAEDLEQTPWFQVAAEEEKNLLIKAKAQYQNVVQAFHLAGDSDSALVLELEGIVHILDQAAASGSGICENQVKLSKNMSYRIFKEDPETDVKVRENFKQAKEAASAAAKIRSAWMRPEDIRRMREIVYPAMLGLKDVVMTYRQASLSARAEANMVSFADQERYALTLLRHPDGTPTQEAHEIRDQYRWICIDEYQDSNDIQEAILNSVARTSEDGSSANVFMVGDVKQSIYRFREARPELFLEKLKTYPAKEGASLALLHQNFRSRETILDAVNAVFYAIMVPPAAELLYDQHEALMAGRSFPEEPEHDQLASKPRLYVFQTSEFMTTDEARAKEARWVAEQIQQIVMSGRKIMDEKTGRLRPVHYGDIVILMRSLAGTSRIYGDALSACAVPYYNEMTEGFYQKKEIICVLNVLRIIDNPRQDIPLAGVLYSPMYNMSGHDLAEIRIFGGQELSFYEQVLYYASEGPEGDFKDRLNQFLQQLASWRTQAGYVPVAELIASVLADTGYDRYAAAMEDGEIRSANLELLISRAYAFENGNYHGLFQFLRYVDRMEAEGRTEVESQLTGDEADVVRLMTIHKSKGLEFPIVFLCDTSHRFNMKDTTSRVLFHPELKLGVSAVENHFVYETLPHHSVALQKKRELLAEEMRVLYVAMTRASEMLYVTGSGSNLDMTSKILPGRTMPVYEITDAKCFLDWLLPVATGSQAWEVYEADAACAAPGHTDLDQEAWGVNVRSADDDVRFYQQLDQTMRWKYSYTWKQQIPSMVTVSQLKKAGLDEIGEEDVQEALLTHKLQTAGADPAASAGAAAGTAIHKVLSRLDIMRIQGPDDAWQQVEELRERGYLSEAEMEKISRFQVSAFAESPLLKTLQSADQVLREQPFIASVSIRKIHDFVPDWMPFLPEEAEDEQVMVQGIMDLCYFENGRWHVVDFKSDRFLPEGRMLQYQRQLSIYAYVMEQMTHQTVADRMLYMTRTGDMLKV